MDDLIGRTVRHADGSEADVYTVRSVAFRQRTNATEHSDSVYYAFMLLLEDGGGRLYEGEATDYRVLPRER